MRSSTFRSSTVAVPFAAWRPRSSSGSDLGSRASPRLTASRMSWPHFDRSNPFGSERSPASFSTVVGACTARSPITSSLSTRPRGDIARLRLALAPARDLHQHREFLRLARARLQPLPGVVGLHAVGFRRGEDPHLLVDPFVALALADVRGQRAVHVAQMRDVGDRVFSCAGVSGRRAQSVKRCDLSSASPVMRCTS